MIRKARSTAGRPEGPEIGSRTLANRKEDRTRRFGERLVVTRSEKSVVERINQQIQKAVDSVDSMKSMSWPMPKIQEYIIVFDIEKHECSVVMIRHLDYRTDRHHEIGELVKFSKRCDAPSKGKTIRMATPKHYREYEGIGNGVGDTRDGLLEMNLTPWISQRIRADAGYPMGHLGSLRATARFGSDEEPWIWCTSEKPQGDQNIRTMMTRISNEYDAATEIRDPKAFGIQLGIDFASNLNKEEAVKLEFIHEWAYQQSNYSGSPWGASGKIDKFINVYHGPVIYEDDLHIVQKLEDTLEPYGAQRAWFTKRTEYSYQQEYRFAVSTPGKPVMQTFDLPVSDELRMFTSEVPLR